MGRIRVPDAAALKVAAKKYGHYSIELRESVNRAAPFEVEGRLYRALLTVRRVPSDRKFIGYVRQGLTAQERATAIRDLENMPRGLWAVFGPNTWKRKRAGNGQIYFQTTVGNAILDPLVQLELEMIIDSTSDFSV